MTATGNNFKILKFKDNLISTITSLSYKIADIEKYLESKKFPEKEILKIDESEFIEFNDPETENFFQNLIEIKEFNENSFFYNSLFTSIYSFLEYSLIKYCLYLNDKDKIKYEFNPNGYIYIEDCITFLKEKCEIDFGQNKEYNIIQNYKKIRDMIMHNQSVMPNDKRFSILKSIKGIDIISNNFICIKDTSMLYEFLKIINQFLTDIIEKTK